MSDIATDDRHGHFAAWQQLRPDLDTTGVALASDLLAAGAHIGRERKAVFERFGLGERGFDVLLALWQATGAASRTAGQLARTLPGGPISSGGVTFVVDRLVRGGLVQRKPHPDDRRAVLMSLTERGKDTAAAVMEALVAVEGRHLWTVEPVLRRGLAAALRQLSTGPDEPSRWRQSKMDIGTQDNSLMTRM